MSTFLFSGQGSQIRSMGTALLQALPRSSMFARTWDDAREHLIDSYGFDLSALVKENPSQLTFRPQTGVPLVTKRYEAGSLNFTPFTQVALLAYQVASFNQLDTQLDKGDIVAGHSLGEFSALVALGIIPFTNALDVVFRRGWIIDSCIERNHKGQSPYKTIIVNPQRCEISEKMLLTTVEAIAAPLMQTRGELIEITCYNVQDQQYVVTGTMIALSVLGKILNPGWRRRYFEEIDSRRSSGSGEDSGSFSDIVREALAEVDVNISVVPQIEQNFYEMMRQASAVTGSVKEAKKQVRHHCMLMPRNPELDNKHTVLFPDTLEHKLGIGSFARDALRKRPWFFPLPHGDIPFHSSVLNKASNEWESVLNDKLPVDEEAYKVLDSVNFIPNVLGKPLKKDPAVYELLIESLGMENIGETWTTCKSGYPPINHAIPPMTYRGMLVSLLSKHLSSAVQWSDTLSYILEAKRGGILEISPQPIFARMVESHAKVKNLPCAIVDNFEESILSDDADEC